MATNNRKKRFLSLLGIALCCVMPLASCNTGSSSLTTPTATTPEDSGGGDKDSTPIGGYDDDDDDKPDSGTILQESEIKPTGTTSGFTENKGKFYSDYKTLDDAHKAGRDLNVQLAEEGDVLLKNENNALPLDRYERRVTLLGVKSIDFQTGGGGSGAGRPGSETDSSYKIPMTTLQSAMEAAGFKVNKKVLDLYEANIDDMKYQVQIAVGTQTLTKELPLSYYTPDVTSTYGSYNDAAIITLSRTGAEGTDLVMHDVPGYSDKTDHYLSFR